MKAEEKGIAMARCHIGCPPSVVACVPLSPLGRKGAVALPQATCLPPRALAMPVSCIEIVCATACTLLKKSLVLSLLLYAAGRGTIPNSMPACPAAAAAAAGGACRSWTTLMVLCPALRSPLLPLLVVPRCPPRSPSLRPSWTRLMSSSWGESLRDGCFN